MEEEKKAETAAVEATQTVISEVEDDELEDLEEIDESFDKAHEEEEVEEVAAEHKKSDSTDNEQQQQNQEEHDQSEEDDLAEDMGEIADFIKSSGGGGELKKEEAKEISAGKTSSKRKRKSKTKKAAAPKKAKVEASPAAAAAAPVTSKRSSTTVKPVQNWRKVLKFASPLEDRLTSAQIFGNVLPTYIPCVPKGTSDRLIGYLTERDVELLCCPGCKDHFVLPTTFFQHVYRKSVDIAFSCQGCRQVLRFHNRCHLKMHVLSHLEVDGIAAVTSDFLSVAPIGEQDLGLGFIDDTYEKELDQAHQTCLEGDGDLMQCPECRLSVRKDDLKAHFEDNNGDHGCDQCHMVLTNPCSSAAHARIHKKRSPFVCPDCGIVFSTLAIFRTHLETSCHHDARTLTLECKLCVQKNLPQPHIDARDLLSHLYDLHVKLYYKCSSCPRAFDNKAAVYEHRAQKHSLEEEGEKSDFCLLYKAPFLRAAPPGNLFKTREAFELRMADISKRWPLSSMYKCVSCQSYFASRDDIARHNRRWCGLQLGSANCSSLFAAAAADEQQAEEKHEKRAKLDKLLSELRTLLGPTGCDEELLRRLQDQGGEHLGGSVDHLPAAAEEDSGHVGRLTRAERRPRIGLSSTASSIPAPSSPAVLAPPSEKVAPESEQIKTEVKDESDVSKGASSSKQRRKKTAIKSSSHHKSQHPEVKPFVESLGKDVPSTRRILAFNQLDKRALALGSSVVNCSNKQQGLKHCCGLCDFTTDLRDSFHAHIRVHRPREANPGEYFQCKECGMSFASESGWRKHLFLLHRIKKPNPGDFCSDLPRKQQQQQQQQQEQQSEEEEEDKTGKDPFSFSEEDDSSSGEPPLTIDEGEVFRPRTNVCTVCARAFSTPLELRRHFRGHGMAFLMTAKTK